ncbi:MAG: hypothetical protein H7Z41_09735 [Cytophagales bacterium]|nr:hypothetical protein [Armatimonadota bacterium]
MARCGSRSVASLFLLLIGAHCAWGQGTSPAPLPPPLESLSKSAAEAAKRSGAPGAAPKSTSASRRSPTRTLSATVVRVGLAENTLLLREIGTGTEFAALLDADSRLVRRNGSAALSAFTAGETVMARLLLRPSLAPKADATVRDLWDESSYAAEQQIRTKISVGKIVANTASALEVRLAPGGELVHFRVSAKTRFLKEAHDVTAASFPVGAVVAIKPRSLPTGGIMAAIVGESEDAVNWAHRDTLITWQGSIVSVDPVAQQITLKREDGATRIVSLSSLTQIRKNRRDIRPAGLQAGDYVRLHLVKGVTTQGFRAADQVSVTVEKPEKADSGQ